MQPGERVAVVGASGGVGRFAVRLARYRGATVTAACSPEDAPLVRDLGAAAVVGRSTTALLEPGPYDVLFDTVGAVPLRQARAALSPSRRLVTLMSTLPVLWASLWNGTRGQQVRTGLAPDTAEAFAAVAALAAQGALTVPLAPLHQMGDLVGAWETLANRKQRGSVVLDVDGRAAERPDRRPAAHAG